MNRLAYELTRVVVPLLILGAGIGAFVVFGKKPQVVKEIPQPATPRVVTEKVTAAPDVFHISVDGVAVPFRQVTLAAQVDGRVTKKSGDSRGGAYVTKGSHLFELDNTDYRLEVDRLEAQLAKSEADLAATKVELDSTRSLIVLAEEELQLQKRELSRSETLSSRGATTDSALDAAKAKELSARRALQNLKDQAAQLEQRVQSFIAGRELVAAELERARANVARTIIDAPLTGTVTEEFVQEDDYVKRGDPLVRISDTDSVEVRLSLTPEEIYWVWLGAGLLSPNESSPPDAKRFGKDRYEIPRTNVEVVFEFQGVEHVWSGTLSRYEGTGMDAQTRSLPCRVVVNDPTAVSVRGVKSQAPEAIIPVLFSGMYVTIRIPIRPPMPLAAVATRALQPGGTVWAVRDGRLAILPVEIARSGKDSSLVRILESGPQPGDAVVTSPLSVVQDGMAVEGAEPQ